MVKEERQAAKRKRCTATNQADDRCQRMSGHDGFHCCRITITPTSKVKHEWNYRADRL